MFRYIYRAESNNLFLKTSSLKSPIVISKISIPSTDYCWTRFGVE